MLFAVMMIALAQFAPAAMTCCITPECNPQMSVSETLSRTCCAKHVTNISSNDDHDHRCSLADLADADEFRTPNSDQLPHGNELFTAVLRQFTIPVTSAPNPADVCKADLHQRDGPPPSRQVLLIKSSTQLLI